MYMDLEQKPVSSELIYHGTVFDVHRDMALMPDGTQAEREVVEHRGGVGIALEDDDGTFFMVRQWRYAQKQVMTEFPAGKKEKGEDPFTTAVREVVEETGYEGRNFVHLGTMVPTPAYDTEVIDMYYAEKGAFKGQHLDPDEYLNVSKMTIDEIIDQIMDGTITDAKTIAMAFMVREYKRRKQ